MTSAARQVIDTAKSSSTHGRPPAARRRAATALRWVPVGAVAGALVDVAAAAAVGMSPIAIRLQGAVVGEREVAGDVGEQRSGRVALGDLVIYAGRPRDGDVRIVPAEAPLQRGVVVRRHLVEDIGDVAEHAEAMRKADGDEELVPLLVVELEGLPFAVR